MENEIEERMYNLEKAVVLLYLKNDYTLKEIAEIFGYKYKAFAHKYPKNEILKVKVD